MEKALKISTILAVFDDIDVMIRIVDSGKKVGLVDGHIQFYLCLHLHLVCILELIPRTVVQLS